jgi:hypothetical protein
MYWSLCTDLDFAHAKVFSIPLRPDGPVHHYSWSSAGGHRYARLPPTPSARACGLPRTPQLACTNPRLTPRCPHRCQRQDVEQRGPERHRVAGQADHRAGHRAVHRQRHCEMCANPQCRTDLPRGGRRHEDTVHGSQIPNPGPSSPNPHAHMRSSSRRPASATGQRTRRSRGSPSAASLSPSARCSLRLSTRIFPSLSRQSTRSSPAVPRS